MSGTDIAAAATAIDAGEVLAFPTETFYALGADPRQPRALQRVLDLKGREAADKPLLLLASGLDQLAPWVRDLPPGFDELVAHFWPGPLTLVLPAKATIAAPLRSARGGVAVRVTSHPLARALIEACNSALTGTSANRAGAAPARNPAQVRAAFGETALHVLDGGDTAGGLPSTLVELDARGARLLRAGAVGEDDLRRVVRLL